MSIPPLSRTSEPFRYHERVVGDVWLQLPASNPAPAGPWVFPERAAALQAWINAIKQAQATVHLALAQLTHAGLVTALGEAASLRRVRIYIITTEGQSPELTPAEKKAHAAALDHLAACGAILQSTQSFHPTLLLVDAATATATVHLEIGQGGTVGEPSLGPILQRLFALGWWRHGVNRLARTGLGKAEQPASFDAKRLLPQVAIDVRVLAKPPAKPVQRLEVAEATKAFVEEAQQHLWVCLPDLASEPALLAQLLAKAKDARCDVRLCLTVRPTVNEQLTKLLAGGVQIRVAAGIPQLIVDDQVMVFAGRLKGRDPVSGLSCAVTLNAAGAAELRTRFAQRWEAADFALRAQAKLGEITTPYLPLAAAANTPFLPAPAASKHVELTTPWTAFSAADLTDSAPHREAKDDPACNALVLTYQWQIVAPKLPADAKEEFKLGPEPTVKGGERSKTPYSPRRFLRGKEVYVLIDRFDAARLAEFRALERQTKVRSVIARDS